MSYVKSVLQPGEKLLMMGHLHWIAYWQAMLFLVLGTGLVWLEHQFKINDIAISITAVTFGVLFLVAFLRTWFVRWITEIAITDRRIIYKRGFINRHTEEMNMDKVASVDVDQTIFGRLLDYGTIHIIGTGGAQSLDRDGSAHGIEHLHRIAHPLAMRNAIVVK